MRRTAHEIAEDLRFHALIGHKFAQKGVPRPIPDYVWAEALAELLDPAPVGIPEWVPHNPVSPHQP